jgi:hypothetical protein
VGRRWAGEAVEVQAKRSEPAKKSIIVRAGSMIDGRDRRTPADIDSRQPTADSTACSLPTADRDLCRLTCRTNTYLLLLHLVSSNISSNSSLCPFTAIYRT